MKDPINSILEDNIEKLFGNLEEHKLNEVKESLEIISLKRGDILFYQNDEADGIYILLSGKLEVTTKQVDGSQKRVGFVNRSETVGEMALISEDLRSATVSCYRNSLLAKMSNQLFLDLCYSNPDFAIKVSKFVVKRLKDSIQTKRNTEQIKNISIYNASLDSEISANSINKIIDELIQNSNYTVVNFETITKYINIQEGDSQYRFSQLDHYLNELDIQDQRLLFDTRLMDKETINHLYDYSDICVEVYDFNGEIHQQEFVNGLRNKLRYIFCHPQATIMPENTKGKLEQLTSAPHIHIKDGLSSDYARVRRYIEGTSHALVLGGGGAKGIAHLGIIHALEDAGIPIDFIAGTSMGSIYAGMYAMFQNFDQTFETSSLVFKSNPTAYKQINILPRYSIYRDSKINNWLSKFFKDHDVEDLWLPFYCISSNISKPEMKIHETGKIKDVIRASMSVPGLFKPVIMNKDVHVDGGIFNNIPIDIMMQKNVGKIIASRVDKEISADDIKKMPNLIHTFIKSTIANSDSHSNQLQEYVDLYFEPPVSNFGLLNWKAHDKIYEVGYKHAKGVLENNSLN